MAGGGPVIGGSSRRKPLETEINLVPFIDLLSVCICFLLMTAVWIQIASLQVKQSHGTEAAAVAKDQLEAELKFEGPSQIRLDFKKSGRISKSIVIKESDMTAALARLDGDLAAFLTTLGGPSKSLVANAMVTPKAGIPYGDLVSVMDVLRKNQITNLGVVPVKGDARN